MFKTFIAALAIFSANVQARNSNAMTVWGAGDRFGRDMTDNMLGDIFAESGLSKGIGADENKGYERAGY